MELSSALGALIEVLTPEFWLLFLVVTMIIFKDYRLGAFMLIFCRLINGHVTWWQLAIIGVFTMFTNYLHPYAYFKIKYENKLKEHGITVNLDPKPKRKDPDLQKK